MPLMHALWHLSIGLISKSKKNPFLTLIGFARQLQTEEKPKWRPQKSGPLLMSLITYTDEVMFHLLLYLLCLRLINCLIPPTPFSPFFCLNWNKDIWHKFAHASLSIVLIDTFHLLRKLEENPLRIESTPMLRRTSSELLLNHNTIFWASATACV